MKTYYMQFGFGDPRQFPGLAPTMLIFSLKDGTAVTPPGITQVGSSTGIYYFDYGVTTPITFLADAATTSPGTQGRYVLGAIDPADRIDEIGATLFAIGVSNIALGTTNVALGTTNVALGTTGIALDNTIAAQGLTTLGYASTLLAYSVTLQAESITLLAYSATIYAIVQTLNLGSVTITVAVAGIGNIGSTIGGATSDPIDLFGYVKRLQENLEGNQTFLKPTGQLTILSRGSSIILANKTVTNSASMVIKQ